MAIKFCVKLGKTAAETLPMIKTAFKENVLPDQQVFRWHKVFLEGREEVDDETRAGRPSTSTTDDNVTRVKELLNTDRRLNVRLLSQLLDIPKTIVHEIIRNNLNMRKMCAKMVPKVFTDEQKLRRVKTCRENLDMCESDPEFLNNVITDDESWVFEYNPETKRQSSE
ncbi:PREDICTED: putative uncharacterized protein FLJ37770 [Dinoponera quadriceps]|uniref:Mos1 transposase HTH domain-containing protein n=1 Tax=Dinoponera quadriceps TaxID=609295 RepID=A0A6P3XT95_DINQU|nr:PREDICTED: putative uncharacterized protein FLJ37770 [Dinoponera quadriceps]